MGGIGVCARRLGFRGLALGGLVALAGCAGGPQLAVPPQPVVVAARGAAVPAAPLTAEVLVRAFVIDDQERRREVGGADCRLETPLYAAAFRTPARVAVPFWGYSSPDLVVTCRAGELAGSAVRPVASRWIDGPGGPWGPWGGWGWGGWPYYGGGWPYYGGSGVSVGLTIGGGYPGGYLWDGGRRIAYYPDIAVTLR